MEYNLLNSLTFINLGIAKNDLFLGWSDVSFPKATYFLEGKNPKICYVFFQSTFNLIQVLTRQGGITSRHLEGNTNIFIISPCAS